MAHISGNVISVDRDGSFVVSTRSKNRKFHISHSIDDLPVRYNDTISCLARLQDSYNATLEAHPLVIPPVDKKSVISNVLFVLKDCDYDYAKACRFFNGLTQLVNSRAFKSANDECDVLTLMADSWGKHGSDDILQLMTLDENSHKKKLLGWWRRNFNNRRFKLLGLSEREIKGFSRDPVQAWDLCLSNPYAECSISYERCHHIMQVLGRRPTEEQLVCGSILRAIHHNLSRKGWPCTRLSWLQKRYGDIEPHKLQLEEEYRLSFETVNDHGSKKTSERDRDEDPTQIEVVYMASTLAVEKRVASFIVEGVNKIIDGEFHLDSLIDESMDPDQKDAVQMVFSYGVSIITGGPGVGKTSTIREICRLFDLHDISYVLSSFTGKAVSRIKEVVRSARAPMTLHRLLSKARDLPRIDYLIIDEASMVTTDLFSSVLDVLPADINLVLIGDANQLPPIGYGSLFSEMLKSRAVPRIVLRTNHRVLPGANGEIDGILHNINRIARWRDGVPYAFEQASNFTVFNGDENNLMEIIKVFKESKFDPTTLKIISPYNACLKQINGISQLIWNEGKKYCTSPSGKIFFVGDIVICTQNDYEIDVMNGEEGIVVDLDADSISVDFGEDRLVTIRHRKLNERRSPLTEEETTTENIDLSFAITVHKCQGSEYPFTIFLMPSFARGGNNQFLNRNLVYTALSRAQRGSYMIGNYAVTCSAIGNPLPWRSEHLSDRLLDCLPRLYDEEEKEDLLIQSYSSDYHPDFDEADFYCD